LPADQWRVAARHWGLDGPANFENENWHLRVALATAPGESALLASARATLLLHREQRVHPGRDDKVLTAWNALMIEGLVHAARVFDRADWLASARRALDFIRNTLWRDGRLLATWRDGKARVGAYLDDHAFLLAALIETMQADFRIADVDFAFALAETLLNRFEDRNAGGFHFTADDHETLIHRPKPAHDNATPAGNAVAARALQSLGRLLGEPRYLEAAERALALFRPQMAGAGGLSSLTIALEDALLPPPTVVLRGPSAAVADWSRRLARQPAAARLVVPLADDIGPLPGILDKPSSERVNAWICSGVTCQVPVTDFDQLCLALQAA
jgi:uncharacterized protein YyaL (SSP411 family)